MLTGEKWVSESFHDKLWKHLHNLWIKMITAAVKLIIIQNAPITLQVRTWGFDLLMCHFFSHSEASLSKMKQYGHMPCVFKWIY